VVDAYQQIFETTTQDIIGFVHDDLVCLETDWDIRVTREFIDPRIGLVGFGGALGAGDPDMYKKPYELRQLARRNFMSNLREANVHGERFTGERDVSVLDGFALFVRRELLVKAGGWPMGTPIDYVGYDMWLCCMARRLGYKIRLVGVACDHIGGKSTGLNKNLEVDFEGAHRYIFDHFMDVLPAEVER
jgi:GT2 family glycosyltransferase